VEQVRRFASVPPASRPWEVVPVDGTSFPGRQGL